MFSLSSRNKGISGSVAVRLLLVFLFFGGALRTEAQHILLVNDNDNITYNTDTIKTDLLHTIYGSYSYWSIPDSAYRVPSDTFMETFDLVIWYASTDGVGLKFWDSTNAGIPQVVNYCNTGRPMWIIGQDLLYDKYVEGTSFSPGYFAYDYMGLESYDVQSYNDDGGLGLPQADRIATASTLFPDSLKWEFSTLWYADGCTPQSTTLGIYEMGPASYVLAGRICMFHNHISGYSVMSTFFDPALMDSFDHRVTFLQNGITYLLGGTGAPQVSTGNSFDAYPNPATHDVQFVWTSTVPQQLNIDLTDALGRRVSHMRKSAQAGRNNWTCDLGAFNSGAYLVSVSDDAGRVLATTRISKL